MKAFVTGASGFLGAAIVDALVGRGHEVRAMVRRDPGPAKWSGRVETVVGDVRHQWPAGALDEIDVVYHLAAGMGGSEEEIFATTVGGTERLVAALRDAPVRRVVLSGSIAVYDWSAARRTLTEETPIAEPPALYRRDGYAISKIWQERVLREAAIGSFELTVLRPGFIWGPDRLDNAGLGLAIGGTYLLFGPNRRLPLTHLENCAAAFALAGEREAAAGQTLNVVDDDEVRVRRYAAEVISRSPTLERAVPLPLPVARLLTRGIGAAVELSVGPESRPPGIFIAPRFDARFKDLRFPAERAREVLGWSPQVSFEEGLARIGRVST